MPDSFSEFGHPAFQGQRSDLDNMWEMARQGFTAPEMLHVFKGNGLRHLGVYQRAQMALYRPYDGIDTQLLYNRVNKRALHKEQKHEQHEFTVLRWGQHLEELQAQFYPEEIEACINAQIMQNNATEVLGNTGTNTSDNELRLPPTQASAPNKGAEIHDTSSASLRGSLREMPFGHLLNFLDPS